MTIWNTFWNTSHADGVVASKGEILTTWGNLRIVFFYLEEAIVKLLLLNQRYFREKQRESCGSMLHLAGFTIVMPFLLHEKSDALQLCKSLHIHKQANSQGNFSEDQFPQI